MRAWRSRPGTSSSRMMEKPEDPPPPPPSYEEAFRQLQFGIRDQNHQSESSNPSTPQTPSNSFLPQSLNLYSQSRLSAEHCYLGSRLKDRLFAVTLGWRARYQLTNFQENPHVTIHENDSILSPPLVICQDISDGHKGRYGVMLSPEGEAASYYFSTEELPTQHAHFWFSVETERNGGQSEDFEWGPASPHELRPEIDGQGDDVWGWKLITRGSKAIDPILAVCAHNSGSLSKFFRFAFVGEGSTGRLGPRWEVLVLATALTVWGRCMEMNKMIGRGPTF